MLAHLRYLAYVLRHKWYVLLGGLRLNVSLWQLLVHDLSKFSRAEWGPYVRRFYGGGNNQGEFEDAWEHHYTRNPHHWDHWLQEIGDDTRLERGDCVFGIGDGLPFLGIIVERRQPVGSPPSSYRIKTSGDEFWAGDHELLQRVLPMPERYVREMVADWYGAGMAMGKPDIGGWYTTSKQYRKLHPETLHRAEQLLEAFR